MSSVFQQFDDDDEDRRRRRELKRASGRKATYSLPVWSGAAAWAGVDEESDWTEDFDFELTEAECHVRLIGALWWLLLCRRKFVACLVSPGGIFTSLRASV
jgi:hypothetical protein